MEFARGLSFCATTMQLFSKEKHLSSLQMSRAQSHSTVRRDHMDASTRDCVANALLLLADKIVENVSCLARSRNFGLEILSWTQLGHLRIAMLCVRREEHPGCL